MSLDPKWTSTIYGVMVIIGDALATLAVMIVVAGFLAADRPMSEIATPGRLNDLGNLMLAFVMLWAYMSFCQFLIIWSGNLSEEIPWYLRRTRGGWEWVALALIAVQLFLAVLRAAVPLEQAQDEEGIARGALDPVHALGQPGLAGHPGLVRPGQPAHSLGRGSPECAVLTVGIGGIWIAFYIHWLKRRPLVPLHDPSLIEALEHAGGH